jgi:hypothetical protein
MFHLANTYFPTTCLIVIVEMTLFIDDTNFDTNVMVSNNLISKKLERFTIENEFSL